MKPRHREFRKRTYVHRKLGGSVTAIGGHYVFDKEALLQLDRRSVLYLVGHAVLDTSCCGSGGCGYVLVLGYIEQWKTRIDEAGYAMTEVIPVHDQQERQRIATLIKKTEMVQQVLFA